MENSTAPKSHDPVHWPAHYNRGKIQPIEFIEDQHLDMHTGNAVKYIARADHKDPAKEVEDLKKAIWYLERKIQLITANQSTTCQAGTQER